MLYAINKITKEHRDITKCDDISFQYIYCDKELWEIVEADSEGWIAWGGKPECPLPDRCKHEVKWEDGGVSEDNEPIEWEWDCLIAPIIAYRPILEENKEEEMTDWDGEGLPPVGVVCEHCIEGMWHKCKILAHKPHGRDRVAFIDEYYNLKWGRNFRPVAEKLK